MDYSQFKFKAVVDWTDIEIQTARTTNSPAIRRRLNLILRLPQGKNVYVKPVDKEASGSATMFRLRIQDPKNWEQTDKILQRLEEHYVFAREPKVRAIEVAVDAYSRREATDHELAEFSVNCYRNMTHLVSENRRVYRNYGSRVESPHLRKPQFINRIEDGYQIGIGNKTDALYQHAYLKTTDDGHILPKEEYRARIEIRLQGREIQDEDFEDWKNFKFQSLSKYFNFRKLKNDLNPSMQFLSGEASFQIGERGLRNTSVGPRLYSPNTEADTSLNEKIYEALRELSRRWKR